MEVKRRYFLGVFMQLPLERSFLFRKVCEGTSGVKWFSVRSNEKPSYMPSVEPLIPK